MTKDYATTPIRADISPTLHPDVAAQFAPVLAEVTGAGNRAYAEAREALATVYETIGQINDTEKALLAAAQSRGAPDKRDVFLEGGGLRHKHGREVEFNRAAQTAFDRAAARYDASVRRMKGDLAALEKQLSEALGGDQPTGPLATEIRAHFKSLPNEVKRMDALMRAAGEKDTATLRAVLNAPPFLSGLTAKDQETMREVARQRVDPQTHGQIQAVAGLIDRVMQAGSALVGRMGAVQAACAREAASPRGVAEKQLRELAAR